MRWNTSKCIQTLTKTLRERVFALQTKQNHLRRRSQMFSYEIESHILRKCLFSICSRFFNLLFKSLHNNDISIDVCHNSAASWQGWQKFRTRGNPLTWCPSVQQLRTWTALMDGCVAYVIWQPRTWAGLMGLRIRKVFYLNLKFY